MFRADAHLPDYHLTSAMPSAQLPGRRPSGARLSALLALLTVPARCGVTISAWERALGDGGRSGGDTGHSPQPSGAGLIECSMLARSKDSSLARLLSVLHSESSRPACRVALVGIGFTI